MTIIIASIIVWIVKEKYDLSWPQIIGLFFLSTISLNLISDIFKYIYYQFFYYESFSTMSILIIVFGIYFFYKRAVESKYIKEWESTGFPLISSFEFSKLLLNECDTGKIRYHKDIPYNRAKYFSSETEADIDMEHVSNIFYEASPADNEMAFQEYGFLVTSLGVIVNKQIEVSQKGKDKTYGNQKTYLSFKDAYMFKTADDSLTVYYANHSRKKVKLDPEELEFIANVFHHSIESGWTYHIEKVILNNGITEEELETIEREADDYYRRINDLDSAINQVKRKRKVDITNKQATSASIAGSLGSIRSELNQNQINDRFGGGQGHGHVGEQYGDIRDKLHFKKAEKLGSSHEKYGADRIVNGENIQTKYHASARDTIADCFNYNGGGAKYLNSDGSMMIIEVPKDQYDSAKEIMANKIKQGQVPNEQNPNNTGKYVKKGAITYEHSRIATKSIFDRKSTIIVDGKAKNVTLGEKIIWSAGGDFLTGATAALPFGVASGLWVYCNSVWQGADKKTALKNSVISAAKPTLTGGVMYMVSSQFARSQMGKATGDLLAKKFLKKQLSNKAKTEAVTKGTMGVITVITVVGPDLTDCLRGRMSMDQLVKNTVSTGVGMASGAAAGAALGSVVPVVGSTVGAVVGGAVGSMGARKIMDKFIEDDAVAMIRFAKEEFIEAVIMSSLSEEEFNGILEKTFLSKKFNKLLKSMYASDDSSNYINEHFISLVEQAYSKRELPDEEEIIKVAMIHYDGLMAV